MGRLKLCNPDSAADEQHDSLPFPSVWSEMQDDARRAPESTVEEIERALLRLQRQIDELQEEVESALHLPAGGSDWPPRAA